jgi:hypothetical protein
LHYLTKPSLDFSEQASINFQTTQERQHYSSPGDSHHPLIWLETLNRSRQSSLRVPACKTIKRLPLTEGIFGASDPSFGKVLYEKIKQKKPPSSL